MPQTEAKKFQPETLDHLMAIEHSSGHIVPFPFWAHRLRNGQMDTLLTPAEIALRNLRLEDKLRKNPDNDYDEYLETAMDRTLATTPHGLHLVDYAKILQDQQETDLYHLRAIEYVLQPTIDGAGVVASIHSNNSEIGLTAIIPTIGRYTEATVGVEIIGDTYTHFGNQKNYPITALSIVRTCIRNTQNLD